MQRRSFIAGTTATLAAPALARAAGTGVLRFVPAADMPSLDPIWKVPRANIPGNTGAPAFAVPAAP